MTSIALPPLSHVRVHAGRALAWWLGELRTLYTDAVRRLRDTAGTAVTIKAGEQRWIVRRRGNVLGEVDWDSDTTTRRQRLREIVAQAGGSPTITIEIPPERVLVRLIELPGGAESELPRVLAYEIARHFPLPAERMFYHHRIAGRSPLRVEIAAVPRDIVEAITGELAAAGLQAAAIAVAPAGNAAPLFLPVATLSRAAAPDTTRRLAAAVALLAVAAIVSWPVAQRVRLAAIDREIAALKPAAEAAMRLRQDARQAADQEAEIARLRAARPPLIGLVDTLSRELPDGTWLTSVSIAGRDVILEGLTPSAATIALTLGRHPDFPAVVFRSPIARDAASGLEHFQLGATIASPR